MSSPMTNLTPADLEGEIAAALGNLLAARRDLGGRFADTDEAWGLNRKPGVFATIQGLRTVAGALIAIPDEGGKIVLDDLDSLLQEWGNVLQDDKVPLFSAAPQDWQQQTLDRLLQARRASWVDATSWALSTAVALNHVFRTNRYLVARCAAYVDRTRNVIANAINELLALQRESGGWSWGDTPAAEAHLYFTWSAIQSYADVFDYVLGESEDQIQIGRDQETAAYLEARIPRAAEVLNDSRRRALDFLARTYLPSAIEQKLSYEHVATETTEVIQPENDVHQVSLTYCYAYLLESLILGGYDQRNASSSAQVAQLREVLAARIRPLVSLGAAALPTASSTLQLEVTVTGKGPRKQIQLRDPSLWAQLLRTAVLYAYYVDWTGIGDPLILDSDGAYARVLGDKRSTAPGKGLWDVEAFNLAVTCRAIEAVIDVYDYVERLNRPVEPVRLSTAGPDLGKVMAEAVFPHLRPLIQGYVEQLIAESRGKPEGDGERIDAASLKPKLETWVMNCVASPFVGMVRSVDTQFVDRHLVDEDAWAKRILSRGAEDVHADAIAYTIFNTMTKLVVLTVAEYLPELLAESILRRSKPEDQKAILETKDGQSISSTVFDALQGAADHWAAGGEAFDAKARMLAWLRGKPAARKETKG